MGGAILVIKFSVHLRLSYSWNLSLTSFFSYMSKCTHFVSLKIILDIYKKKWPSFIYSVELGFSNFQIEGHLSVMTYISYHCQIHPAQCTWGISFSFSDTFNDSVQFSHSVMSNSLRPQELQHSRLSCPSPTPRVYSNSCPLSPWCHPITSSSIDPFSSCLQSFLESGFFPMSQFFTSGGQSIGVSA